MMYSSWIVQFASEEVIDRFLANVDVWKTIFEMLPLKDRIQLEMTNKRLGMLMLACWKRVTSFDTECTGMSDNPSISNNRWAAIVSICVNRIGDGLRSLTIRELFPTTVWSAHVPSIGKGCPNVETINFVLMNMTRDMTWDIPFDSFSRLKTLRVWSPGAYFPRASASIFLSIPTSIEVLRGLGLTWDDPFENAAHLEGFFADRPLLSEVDFDCPRTRDESKADIFRVIAQRCPHLKSIDLAYSDTSIDFSGVFALDSMKELRLRYAVLDERQIVTICERSPLIEDLKFSFRLSSNLQLQAAALNALGSLTKLVELRLYIHDGDGPAPSLLTEFVRKLGLNSGSSLRYLDLPFDMPLSTAAIEALGNGCRKLRRVEFYVCVGEAEPASVRFLIDSIVANASWVDETGERTLLIYICVRRDGGDVAEAGRAAFEALTEPAANLPDDVELTIS